MNTIVVGNVELHPECKKCHNHSFESIGELSIKAEWKCTTCGNVDKLESSLPDAEIESINQRLIEAARSEIKKKFGHK